MKKTRSARAIRWADVTNLDIVTEEETAQLLRVDVVDLESWRSQDPPVGPPFIRYGGRIRYRVLELKAFVRDQLKQFIRAKEQAEPPRRDH